MKVRVSLKGEALDNARTVCGDAYMGPTFEEVECIAFEKDGHHAEITNKDGSRYYFPTESYALIKTWD